ncbi:hypothetical protein FD754_001447 [Muntiacus muntjak]|uniref:Uncharacterized protein n=1 Tax=Muntiacus muntjak TaxID=9888 RepID=A0A5N3W6M0_MUNMU|nr:hypothetical protein FD754_001447 [Muntiacus muntjak]
MVQNHLSCEASSFHGWIIFAVTSHIAMMDIFDRHILDIEAHTVPRKGFPQCFMVHFYRLHFSCYIDWRKGDHHARFENTSLHTTHRDSTNTTNFIDILERQMQGFVSWVSWWQGAVQSFKQSGSTGIVVLTGDFPSLEPWHVSNWLQHVVTIPARNWHKCYCVGVVANFLNVGADFLTISSYLSGYRVAHSSVYSCYLFLYHLLLLGPYHFCPLLSPSLHKMFPWYL